MPASSSCPCCCALRTGVPILAAVLLGLASWNVRFSSQGQARPADPGLDRSPVDLVLTPDGVFFKYLKDPSKAPEPRR